MYSRNVGGGTACLVWITTGVNICLAPGASTGCPGGTTGLFPGSCKGMLPWVGLGGEGARASRVSLGAGSEATLPVQGP